MHHFWSPVTQRTCSTPGGRRAAGAGTLTARSAGTGALEAEWRRECLAFARVRKLAHVEEMRVLYLVRRPLP